MKQRVILDSIASGDWGHSGGFRDDAGMSALRRLADVTGCAYCFCSVPIRDIKRQFFALQSGHANRCNKGDALQECLYHAAQCPRVNAPYSANEELLAPRITPVQRW